MDTKQIKLLKFYQEVEVNNLKTLLKIETALGNQDKIDFYLDALKRALDKIKEFEELLKED
jgi:hypothetical protein